MKVHFHPAADQELWRAIAWYDEREAGLGNELELDVYDALELIVEHPNAWRSWPDLPDVRVFPIGRFPFSIPYVIDRDRVVVLAIAHGKRAPGYWRSRLAAT